jgi:succinoglycan biosynthesis protein ExoA
MTKPFVSVIVPVRNEESYIERCLGSLEAQDYPREQFEVIVVDGRSEDATRDLVARFAAESSVDLRLLDNPRQKTAAGLNRGLEKARGDIVVRVDGHASIAGDYLSTGVRALLETQADCVGGVIEAVGDTWIGRAIAIAMSSRFGVGGVAFRVGGEGSVETVAFGAYRRDVFERIGHFTEDIDKGEDDEFNYRLLDAGGRILLIPDMHAEYVVRNSLCGLARQYAGYGRAKPAVLARHPAQARARQFVPAAFVAAIVTTAMLALAGRTAPFKILLAVYWVAAATASLVAAPKHGLRCVPLLPAVFASLHVSNGLGFLIGLTDLAGRHIVGRAASTTKQDSETHR